VAERLPKDQQAQTKSLMRASWRLEAKEGIATLEKMAKWLEREHPDAADSLREGMDECFTINRLNIPPSLHGCEFAGGPGEYADGETSRWQSVGRHHKAPF